MCDEGSLGWLALTENLWGDRQGIITQRLRQVNHNAIAVCMHRYPVFLPELKAKRGEGLKRQPHQRA